MADCNKSTVTQVQADRLLMPPLPSPSRVNGAKVETMTLRSRKNKRKVEPEGVVTTTEDTTDTTDTTKKPEDDLPPIKPLTKAERRIFPGIELGPRLFETMTPEEVELWRELEPQAGDHTLTVEEVDKLCDALYRVL